MPREVLVHTTMIAVIAMSVLFQFIAALFALRLIPITGKKTAWLLVAFAISLMTVRRFQSLVLLLSGQSSAAPDVFFEAVGLVISCCMMAGLYLVQPLFRAMASSRDELRGMNEKLSSLSAEQTTLIVKLQDALAKIKTLRGLLPICASCKKIRDDKGYWSQIEVYVRDHSDAEFSHGLCPGCAQKYYDQLAHMKSNKE
jgi:hypothetical protein